MANEKEDFTMVQGAGMKAIDSAIGMVTAPISIAMQERANKRLGKFNQGLALEMWDRTNYAAQRRQMEKAGLNVGLMYKGAGEGGTTAGGQAGNSAQAQPFSGMGLEFGLLAQQTKAQTELAQAQANLADAQAKKIGGSPDEPGTERAFLVEQIKNESTRGAILGFERDMKDTDAYLQRMTVDEALDKIRNESARVKEQLDMDKRQNKLQEETYLSAVQKLKNDAIEGATRIALNRQGVDKMKSEIDVNKKVIDKMKEEIFKMHQDQLQGWTKLSQSERELQLKQMLGEFGTNLPSSINQWVEIFTDIIGTVGGVVK